MCVDTTTPQLTVPICLPFSPLWAPGDENSEPVAPNYVGDAVWTAMWKSKTRGWECTALVWGLAVPWP